MSVYITLVVATRARNVLIKLVLMNAFVILVTVEMESIVLVIIFNILSVLHVNEKCSLLVCSSNI